VGKTVAALGSKMRFCRCGLGTLETIYFLPSHLRLKEYSYGSREWCQSGLEGSLSPKLSPLREQEDSTEEPPQIKQTTCRRYK